MNIYEIPRLALKALKERKVRSALTILMVTIGVALMTTLNGMGGGFDVFLNRQLSNLAPNLLIVNPTPLIHREFGPIGGPKITLTDQTVSTIQKLPGVKEVHAAYLATVRVISGGKALEKLMLGMDPDAIRKISPAMGLHSGTMLNQRQANGVMLGFGVAYPTAESEPFATVGQSIAIEYTQAVVEDGRQRVVTERRTFIVVGVFKPTDQFLDNALFVTIEAAKGILIKERGYSRIYVLTNGVEVNDTVESEIKKQYRETVSVTSPQAIAKTIQELLRGWRAFVFSIGMVSLIVGAVGILLALYTSVLERVREIGIMKALGFSNAHILILYLCESMGIGVLGGIAGLGAGVIAAEFLTESVMRSLNAPPIDPVFLPESMLSVFFLALLLSAIAGLYPAWRAAKLDPVVALRRE